MCCMCSTGLKVKNILRLPPTKKRYNMKVSCITTKLSYFVEIYMVECWLMSWPLNGRSEAENSPLLLSRQFHELLPTAPMIVK